MGEVDKFIYGEREKRGPEGQKNESKCEVGKGGMGW